MVKQLFDTKQKIESALADFKILIIQPGWKLIEDIADGNIEILSQQIIDGFEGETPEEINRLRSNLKLLKEFRDTPYKWIKAFEASDTEEMNFDPYEQVGDKDEKLK